MTVEHDPVLNETVIRGLTGMHVRSILGRMKVNFKLEVETGTPSIPYRETISANAEPRPPQKQTGGADGSARSPQGSNPSRAPPGLQFVDQVKGGVIPYNPSRPSKGRARSARLRATSRATRFRTCA